MFTSRPSTEFSWCKIGKCFSTTHHPSESSWWRELVAVAAERKLFEERAAHRCQSGDSLHSQIRVIPDLQSETTHQPDKVDPVRREVCLGVITLVYHFPRFSRLTGINSSSGGRKRVKPTGTTATEATAGTSPRWNDAKSRRVRSK